MLQADSHLTHVDGSVHSSHEDTINELAVDAQDDGVGGLAGGYVVGRLLQLHHLLVACTSTPVFSCS